MSILIKDMEMPKEGFVEVTIRANGIVQITGESYRLNGQDYYHPAKNYAEIVGTAVPVRECVLFGGQRIYTEWEGKT